MLLVAVAASVSELDFTPSAAPKWTHFCACCSVSTGTRCEAALVQGRNKVLSTFLSDAVTCELCCSDTSSPWHRMNCSWDECAANFDIRSSVIYTKDNQMEAGKWEAKGKTTNLFSLLERSITHREPVLVLWVNLQQHKEESQSLVGIASITRWVSAPSWRDTCPSFELCRQCKNKLLCIANPNIPHGGRMLFLQNYHFLWEYLHSSVTSSKWNLVSLQCLVRIGSFRVFFGKLYLEFYQHIK